MKSDARAARVLNITMLVVLGGAVLALIGSSLASDLAAVRDIYSALSREDQRHVLGLVNSVVMFLLATTVLRNLVERWLASRRARQIGGQ